MRAMILAAGHGKRLRPITNTIPKPLVEVRGRSLIERHLDAVKTAGVQTVVINLGWLGHKIEERIGDGSQYGLEVLFSDETDEILETGGGIFKALPLLGNEPFLVINGDIFTDMSLPSQPLRDNVMGHLVLIPTPSYKSHGDFDLSDGKIQNAESPTLTFSGIAVYRPEFFDGCTPGRFSLAPMLKSAANDGLLTGELYRGIWEDVGTVERLEQLNESD